MTQIETIGDATLYRGDCREIVPTLSMVEAVVTDPPYGTDVTTWDISIDAATVSAIIGASKGYSAFFYSNTRLAHLLNAVRDHGHDAWVAVWHKSNAMGFERRFAPQWVPIVIAYKGNPPFWGKDLFACPIRVQKDIDHPTPKQPAITEWLVERSAKVGGTVLDAFMGSGTTGIAAAKLSRKFIGIEVDQKYFDAACRRIEKATQQSNMFAGAEKIPMMSVFEREAIAKRLFEMALSGHAQWDEMAEPHKNDWRAKADAWILDANNPKDWSVTLVVSSQHLSTPEAT